MSDTKQSSSEVGGQEASSSPNKSVSQQQQDSSGASNTNANNNNNDKNNEDKKTDSRAAAVTTNASNNNNNDGNNISGVRKNAYGAVIISGSENKATGGVEVTENDFLNNLEARVTLSRRRNNLFYLQRARRLLRMFSEIRILGASFDISRACLVVELLRKEETGYIKKVETRMHLSTNNGEFGEPQPVIEFVIGRGNYGEYVTGFAQRKFIELFESSN